ncbi:MAG TPA: hypothetical protein VGV87_00515 [Blastocatellia bacterium]|jgi:DNA repair exonuclease SbcCD ATPase subunit|nr:hypothetical protein [Blastocatellia bacterium]
MKTSVMGPALCLAALVLLTPHRAFCQSSDKPAPTSSVSEKVLRDIFNEVHLLRVEMLRTSVNNYRSQILLNRIKVEQDQVARLTREMNDIQDKVVAIRGQQTKGKGGLEELVKKKDAGIVAPEFVNALTLELEELGQREEALLNMESRVAAELDSARAKLAELDTRLNEIEREMVAPGAGADEKPPKRRR